jgi:PHP family Zn ribbon phosphoesterase
MRLFRADLHIHTCLSPCAELDMTPRTVVREALRARLDIIAVCDHNSGENVPAVRRLAKAAGMVVIPGMEITSREEVHVLALFEHARELEAMQRQVYAHLPDRGEAKAPGQQLVVNEQDEVVRFNRKLLPGAVSLSLEDTIDRIHSLDGIAIASHIDREGFGIIGQLGFIPPGLPLDALEIAFGDPSVAGATSLPFVTSSDAHQPDLVGSKFTSFYMEAPSFREIKQALAGRGGRRASL